MLLNNLEAWKEELMLSTSRLAQVKQGKMVKHLLTLPSL